MKIKNKNLKKSLEKLKKNYELLEKKYEEDVAKINLKTIADKHSPKYRPEISFNSAKIAKKLTGMPLILQIINQKIEGRNTTLERFFYELTLSFSHMPSIKDIVSALDLTEDYHCYIEELARFFNSKDTISLIPFKEFCQRSKFVPFEIQKILQHITLRLQLQKVPRDKVFELFSKKTD